MTSYEGAYGPNSRPNTTKTMTPTNPTTDATENANTGSIPYNPPPNAALGITTTFRTK